MRIHFAGCLVAIANAVERNFGSPWYYGSFGHHGSGFVDQNYDPNALTFTAAGYYTPQHGGYKVVSFPEHVDSDGVDKRDNGDSPSDSYDSFSDWFFSADDSYNHSGHSEDSNQSQYYISNDDMFDNPKNDNVSISRDSASDFDRMTEAGFSHHGRRHCFDVNNDLSDNSGDTLSLEPRIVCYYSDSDDGSFHSEESGVNPENRDSDPDSEDTNTTDDGSEGTDTNYVYEPPMYDRHQTIGQKSFYLTYPFSVLNPAFGH